MTVARMCQLGQVSRAGFYRFDPGKEREDPDMDLRDEIQRIAVRVPLLWPTADHRRATAARVESKP
jgi:hypothetical protein